MAKSFSLAAHRNKVESKRKRELAKSLVNCVGNLVKERDIRAYAIVGIDAEGQAHALWDTGNILPMWAFPDTVSYILRTDIQASNVEDGWKPNLTLKG